MNTWKELIVIMLDIRNKLYEADKEQLWEYHYPEVAAQMQTIANTQEKLNLKLPKEYVDFLLCANGWRCFYQLVDLFGTKDFETESIDYARKMLEVEINQDESLYKMKDNLLPVAVSRTDKDLFVLVLEEGETYGQVIWLAGGEVDRFQTFRNFFESMIEYNREELWNEVIDMFNNSERKIHIYEGLETVGRLELEKMETTYNSILEVIILHTAGICVDNWIRIIGQKNDEHNGIFEYNSIKCNSENDIMKGMFIVAQDIVGGIFAINVSKYGDDIKMVWYFAPDTLEWECLDMNYAQFLAWVTQGNLDEFYSSMRWVDWEKDCEEVGFDKAWLIYPFLWSQECDLETASKKVVPFMELKELNTDYAKRLSNL